MRDSNWPQNSSLLTPRYYSCERNAIPFTASGNVILNYGCLEAQIEICWEDLTNA